ncbi:hypothetical protein Tco_1229813 [Tanacetum coccineum]
MTPLAIVLENDCALSKTYPSYLNGGIVVLLEFSSMKSKEAFSDNMGVSSWFSEIRQASFDIKPRWSHCSSPRGFNDFVTSTWNSAPSVDSNGMRNLAGKLKFLKAHIKIWIKDNKSETVSTIANLKKELNQLDAVIDKGTGTEVEAEKEWRSWLPLRNLDPIIHGFGIKRPKIKRSIEGDENSNFFHGILNKKRNQMNIRGITIDGVWKEQPNDVKQEFLSHFQDRFRLTFR